MIKEELRLLQDGIIKYKSNQYSEANFHQTLNGFIYLITELHLEDIRDALQEIEGNLELIDFTSNDKQKGYLREISKIEKIITLIQIGEKLS